MTKSKIKNLSDYKSYDDWVASILSENKKQTDLFLKEALKDFEEDNDVGTLLIALRQVAKARGGFTILSEKTGFSRETLYRTLSKAGNPTIVTLKSILDALGYCLTMKVAKMA
ncbi:MAG: putative addiction module antidote protein [Alphaproteobacteria bacterium RIFCSPLOWO2_01_FULL_40_26]|nr:MAG: putative addiction module antidote protein [Alphaproteobacteria bacterium RIFCSPHIGHO2_02_FULL_40_34]OFW88416.1 MAG: putative addiction module antidote protein [Alphaproteobacteria bacterium RIFCSPHIGHO2_01_FULL_40_8]OFW94370.1 MAG: putative addiction module antidote protein [Alphaproteobacteria bacterium RIFCSPLOWO2_01_FULL_40_26]OFX09482.1 MAG: putative addiction module antidote protein [Alphaproteobacteria bacterium RIFCSPLOWO2_02_FULL_40_19]OFX12121.1 MAG: putative addiction module 